MSAGSAKKERSHSMSNPDINNRHDAATATGALGGNLSSTLCFAINRLLRLVDFSEQYFRETVRRLKVRSNDACVTRLGRHNVALAVAPSKFHFRACA